MKALRASKWVVAWVVAITAAFEFLSPALAQMKPEQVEREVDPRQNPFALRGVLSPETPVEGDVVEISAEVRSRVFPHIRTLVRIWIDGDKREESSYVIAPRAESVVVHDWTATPGPHTILIEVLSPAGVRYAAWERRIVVRKKSLRGPKAWADDALVATVPAPTGVAKVEVSAGNSYPLPWSGVERCDRPLQAGCYRVNQITSTHAVLDYPRVELQGGALKPQGFRYVTPVTVSGSGYELFVIKHGGGREEWIYAFLETVQEARASLRFIKLPAFVTDRARLTARISIDSPRRRYREHYTVEAEEPLTLIGVGRLETIFPGGRLEGIEINGMKSPLPYADIIHFNLPAGRHEVTVEVAFGRPAVDLTIQGTLLEPRRMSLIHGLELRVESGPLPAELEVRTVGLPNEIWEAFKSTLVVEPPPAAAASDRLAVRYSFGASETVTLKARPRIPVGPNNYPVMISIKALGGQ